jgi:hypothetical protein
MPVGLCQYFCLILQDNNSFLNVVDRNDDVLSCPCVGGYDKMVESTRTWRGVAFFGLKIMKQMLQKS